MAMLSIFPFYWMFVLATHNSTNIFDVPPPFWFGNSIMENYRSLIDAVDFWTSVWNSVYISVMATITTLFFCSLAGYGFAMYDFKYKNQLFTLLFMTLMIPQRINIIPYFLIIDWLGWLSTARAIYLPGMASAFGIFLMRQYIGSSIPKDLLYAGRIDGLSEFGIYFKIVLPLIKPIMATLGIITFINQWNNFLSALIVLRDKSSFTLPLILRSLQGVTNTEWGAMMIGTALSVFPLLVVFVFASKRIIGGLTSGALKQ